MPTDIHHSYEVASVSWSSDSRKLSYEVAEQSFWSQQLFML